MQDFDHSPPPGTARLAGLAGPLADALAILAQAHCYAADVGRDAWDFAVEASELFKAGASYSDLRWLLYRGLAEHQEEVAALAGSPRRFAPTASGALTPRSCFVITDLGMDLAADDYLKPPFVLSVHHDPPPPSIPFSTPGTREKRRSNVHGRPFFDQERCELYFEGRLVKAFRRTAPCQQTILAAFEEASWPARIDDPLPPREGICPKRRLSDAIKGLNRRQNKPAIHFLGDGTGEGVLWEPPR